MSRPLRYIVEFPDHAVSYSCSLGTKTAMGYAYQTASRYAGRIVLELTDNTFDLIRDFSHRRSAIPGDSDYAPIVEIGTETSSVSV